MRAAPPEPKQLTDESCSGLSIGGIGIEGYTVFGVSVPRECG